MKVYQFWRGERKKTTECFWVFVVAVVLRQGYKEAG
jgi:hypothetical protein